MSAGTAAATQGYRLIHFNKRHDNSYFVWSEDPALKRKRSLLGVVRRLARRRWIAITPTMPPDAAEFRTRGAAAAWLEQEHKR